MNKLIYSLIISVLYLLLHNNAGADMTFVSDCQVVPHATFSAPLTTTVVGLHANPNTGSNARVRWAFFDANGGRRDSGDFALGPNQLSGFVWSTAADNILQDVDGFLLFCLDSNNNARIDRNDGENLGASALFIDSNSDDVAFIPVFPVDFSSLSQDQPDQWITTPVQNTAAIWMGYANTLVTMQYAINGVVNDGDDTTLYIWSSNNTLGSFQNVNIFTNAGATKAVTIFTPDQFLNVIDLETVAGIDSVFTGGFINWTLSTSYTGTAFVFTVIKSPSFGAIQTLIALTKF